MSDKFQMTCILTRGADKIGASEFKADENFQKVSCNILTRVSHNRVFMEQKGKKSRSVQFKCCFFVEGTSPEIVTSRDIDIT